MVKREHKFSTDNHSLRIVRMSFYIKLSSMGSEVVHHANDSRYQETINSLDSGKKMRWRWQCKKMTQRKEGNFSKFKNSFHPTVLLKIWFLEKDVCVVDTTNLQTD